MTRSHIHRLPLLAVATLALAPLPRAQSPHGSIDEAITAYMQGGHIPGVAVAIIKGDQVVWAKGYGSANLELGTTVSLDTPFFLASISKTATATTLMQLRNEGLFALNDDVTDALAFDIVNLQVHVSGVTYRQLLTHTASLKDNWTVMDPLYQPGDSIWQLADFHPQYWVPGGMFYDQFQNFWNTVPGTAYYYCNQGFSLLGLLGQNLSGVPFEDLAAQRVFEPLGMTHTSFRLSDFDPATLAMPYSWNQGTMQYVAEGHYGYPDWPAGTMRSSILDLAKFLRAYINDGTTEGVELLPPATVAEMLTVQFPAFDPQGLCFYYITEPFGGTTVVGHDGGDPGVLTDMYFRPSDGTGVILLANGDNGFDQYWAIYQRLWQEADVVSEAWHYLGQGLDGSDGQPYLEGKGDLVVGQPFELGLERALPGAAAYLTFGLAPLNAPFKGGTLVPDVGGFGGILPLVTNPLGEIDLGGTWPSGVPSGTELYLQFWIEDPAGPFGFAASNALRGTTS